MILITGGNGFIGSNFIQHLIEETDKQYEIINIDKRTDVSSNWISEKYKDNDMYTEIVADIKDIEDIEWKCAPDLITHCVHFAAESHVDNSIADVDPFIQTNIAGTYAVALFCAKHGIPMVHISTDEVYGHLTEDDEHARFDITDELLPRNPYAASKASAELMITAVSNMYEAFSYCIVRPSNNYGSHQDNTKLIPKIIKCISEGTPFPMYGNGKFYREWTHVSDTCTIISSILTKPSFDSEVYNISSEEELSNIDVFCVISKIITELDSTLRGCIEFIQCPRGGAHDIRYRISNTLTFEYKKFERAVRELVKQELNG